VNPGLSKRYKEKTKLRIVKCDCGHEFATSMKIPRCSNCGTYFKKLKLDRME